MATMAFVIEVIVNRALTSLRVRARVKLEEQRKRSAAETTFVLRQYHSAAVLSQSVINQFRDGRVIEDS